MSQGLHVVLGAAGSVGESVIEELLTRNLKVRAVARNKKIDGVETVSADLLDVNQTIAAVKGASYVYLCVGIPYRTKSWQQQWPIVMRNVIKACEQVQAKLIFLDNIYMYGPGPLKTPITESHTQNPSSEKGKVRKVVADMLMEAHYAGKVKAVIGRSADFYGPNVVNSALYISILERMVNGKAPQSISKTNIQHTYAYTKDNGRALVALALDDSTYGQVWHLPVSKPVTIDEVLPIFNKMLGSDFKASILPRFMLNLLAIFIPAIKEVKEMLYQFDHPYILNDKKFRNHFPDFVVTDFEAGAKEMVRSFMK